MSDKLTFQSFMNSPYFSIKHTNYFDIYDKVLNKYVGESITFIEIGILDGGSLFMWRDFFGERARIIGVDLNPEATKWREHGFEIFIGDQSKPEFWQDLFEEIGDVHVLLDDGGHRNDQQIITTKSALPHILDGGSIIIEDTQTSFMKFESFQKYTFVSFLQSRITSLYARSDDLRLKPDIFSKSVHSMEFFSGVCVLHVDRTKCESTQRIGNNGIKNNSRDFRYENDNRFLSFLRKIYDMVSLDYLSEVRRKKYVLTAKFMRNKYCRFVARLVIIPLRAPIYFAIKLVNTLRILKLLKEV